MATQAGPDHSWTVGDNSSLSHTRLIAYGGFGEVHEVALTHSKFRLADDA